MRRVVLAEGRCLRLGLPLELEVVPPCINGYGCKSSVVWVVRRDGGLGGSIQASPSEQGVIVEIVVQSMHPAVPP